MKEEMIELVEVLDEEYDGMEDKVETDFYEENFNNDELPIAIVRKLYISNDKHTYTTLPQPSARGLKHHGDMKKISSFRLKQERLRRYPTKLITV